MDVRRILPTAYDMFPLITTTFAPLKVNLTIPAKSVTPYLPPPHSGSALSTSHYGRFRLLQTEISLHSRTGIRPSSGA